MHGKLGHFKKPRQEEVQVEKRDILPGPWSPRGSPGARRWTGRRTWERRASSSPGSRSSPS